MGYEERPQQPPLRLFGGLNTKDSELGLPGSDSPYLVNVDLHPEGSIRMRRGSLSLSTPNSETKINAVMRLDQPEQNRGWVYVIGGDDTIYRVPEPGTWTWQTPTHASTYTLPSPAQQSYGRANSRYYDESGAVEHPSVIYLPRSNGAPLILLGQTSATGDIITLPQGVIETGGGIGDDVKGYPPDWTTNAWPKYMRLMSLGHGSRMYAWGLPAYPHKLAYSELDVPYNWMLADMSFSALAQPLIDGGYVMVREGDGDKITTVVDMFGYKVIFKRRHCMIFTGDPGHQYDDEFPWLLQAEFPVGCVSDRAWVKVGNDIIFWAEDGLRVLSAVQEYGDLAQSNLSFKINDQVRLVAPGQYERVCCYHDITNMRVVFFVPSPGSTRNDTVWVYYYNSQKWAKWEDGFADMMDVEVVRTTEQQNDRIIGGSYENGMVQLQIGSTDANIDESSDDDIAADYYTNWINVGEISDATRQLFLDVLFGDDGPNVDIYYQTDLNEEWTQVTRIDRSIGGGGSAWGNLTWGVDAWGVTARAIIRYELDQLFHLIRFRFAKTGGAGFEVMAYRLEARQKGTRA